MFCAGSQENEQTRMFDKPWRNLKHAYQLRVQLKTGCLSLCKGQERE